MPAVPCGRATPRAEAVSDKSATEAATRLKRMVKDLYTVLVLKLNEVENTEPCHQYCCVIYKVIYTFPPMSLSRHLSISSALSAPLIARLIALIHMFITE